MNPYKRARLIQGGSHVDARGSISFVNDFDFKNVCRFYCITPKTKTEVRAWQGHKIESKWFYCISGVF